jgi:dTMP kinase
LSTPHTRNGLGRLITVEGLDGSGKSSQIQTIVKALEEQGITVVKTTREPGGTDAAEALRKVLLGSTDLSAQSEILIALAARLSHQAEIQAALDRGTWVVCDRYTDSTLAYQFAGGMEVTKYLDPQPQSESDPLSPLCSGRDGVILKILEILTWEIGDNVHPGMTLLYRVPPEIARGRVLSRHLSEGTPMDRIETRDLEFFTRVATCYDKLAENYASRIKVVDASQSIDLVAAQTQGYVAAYCKRLQPVIV